MSIHHYYKNDKYLKEVYETLKEDKDYLKFEERFKSFDQDNLVQLYFVKLSNDLNEDFLGEYTREYKINRLYKIGNFLDKTKKLEEMLNEQNNKVKESTKEDFKEDSKNPFLVTKEELLNEFDRDVNQNKADEIIDFKMVFWENKLTKTLQSIINSANYKYDKKNNKEIKETTRNLYDLINIISVKAPECENLYKKYLNLEITRAEFERGEEYEKFKEEVNNFNIKTGNNFKPYQVLNNISLNNNKAKSYINKSLSAKEIAIDNRSIDVKYMKDKHAYQLESIQFITKENKFPGLVRVHLKVDDIEKIKENHEIEYSKLKSIYKWSIPNVVLLEYSEDKCKKIEEISKNINNGYHIKTKRVINYYGKTLGFDVPKIINENEIKRTNKEKNKSDIDDMVR